MAAPYLAAQRLLAVHRLRVIPADSLNVTRGAADSRRLGKVGFAAARKRKVDAHVGRVLEVDWRSPCVALAIPLGVEER